jgi:hypothetical protein
VDRTRRLGRAGIPGFYIGHLPAGDSVGYTDTAIGSP